MSATALAATGDAVIDIGCGPGFLCEQMADAVGNTGRVLGIDISEDLLAVARARNTREWLTYEPSDAAALGAPDRSFDVTVSIQVHEYPDQAIAEMFRVLKPGGRALIMNTDWDRVAWYSSECGPDDEGQTGLGGALRAPAPAANPCPAPAQG